MRGTDLLSGFLGGHNDSASVSQGVLSDSDLLTMELQLRKEGTLPPDVQRRLLEYIADRPIRSS